jgi:hypothetical protein
MIKIRYQFGAVIDDSFKSKEMEEGEKQLIRHREMQRRAADRKHKLQVDKATTTGADRRSESNTRRSESRDRSFQPLSSSSPIPAAKVSMNDKVSIISQTSEQVEEGTEEKPNLFNLWGNKLFIQARDAIRNPAAQQVSNYLSLYFSLFLVI